jgi:hypothetical protein
VIDRIRRQRLALYQEIDNRRQEQVHLLSGFSRLFAAIILLESADVLIHARSKRSRFITLFHAATKSPTNACRESLGDHYYVFRHKSFRNHKRPVLAEADELLTRLRLLFCLSFEMQFINLASYEFGSLQIAELGKCSAAG